MAPEGHKRERERGRESGRRLFRNRPWRPGSSQRRKKRKPQYTAQQVRARAAGSAHAPWAGSSNEPNVRARLSMRKSRWLVSARMLTEGARAYVEAEKARAHFVFERAWCLAGWAALEISSSNPRCSAVLTDWGRVRQKGGINVLS